MTTNPTTTTFRRVTGVGTTLKRDQALAQAVEMYMQNRPGGRIPLLPTKDERAMA